jgi:hypothetical protein
VDHLEWEVMLALVLVAAVAAVATMAVLEDHGQAAVAVHLGLMQLEQVESLTQPDTEQVMD